MEINLKVDTSLGTECQHVGGFMGPCARKTGRLDLRPRTCPLLNNPQFQDPGSAVITGLFLGLFDVTHCRAVAVGTPMALFDTVWHCFDHGAVLY